MKFYCQLSFLLILLISIACQTQSNKSEPDGKKLGPNAQGYENVLEFSESLAAARQDGKWGFIDDKGELKIPLKYDEAKKFNHGIAQVKEGDKEVFINHQGKQISYEPCQYNGAGIGLHLDEYYLQHLVFTTLLTRDAFIFLLFPNEISGIGSFKGTGLEKAKENILKAKSDLANFEAQTTEIIETLSLVETDDLSEEIIFFKNLQPLGKTSMEFTDKAQALAEKAGKNHSDKDIIEIKAQARTEIDQIKTFVKVLKQLEEQE